MWLSCFLLNAVQIAPFLRRSYMGPSGPEKDLQLPSWLVMSSVATKSISLRGKIVFEWVFSLCHDNFNFLLNFNVRWRNHLQARQLPYLLTKNAVWSFGYYHISLDKNRIYWENLEIFFFKFFRQFCSQWTLKFQGVIAFLKNTYFIREISATP